MALGGVLFLPERGSAGHSIRAPGPEKQSEDSELVRAVAEGPAAAQPVFPTGASPGWCLLAGHEGVVCPNPSSPMPRRPARTLGLRASQPRAPHPSPRPSGSCDWPLAGLRWPLERWPLSSYGLEAFRLTHLGSPKVGSKNVGGHCPRECSGLMVGSVQQAPRKPLPAMGSKSLPNSTQGGHLQEEIESPHLRAIWELKTKGALEQLGW